jgi:hypothetical protein
MVHKDGAAPWTKHSCRFGEKSVEVRQVMDKRKAVDEVDAVVAERQLKRVNRCKDDGVVDPEPPRDLGQPDRR